MKIGEAATQKAVLDLMENLRLKGQKVYGTRTNSGKVRTIDGRWVQLCRPGWPDITACVNGRFVGIETKTSTGKVRESQEDAKSIIERMGGTYLILRDLSVARDFFAQQTNDYAQSDVERSVMRFCEECAGADRAWIENCPSKDCPLWDHRMGRNG